MATSNSEIYPFKLIITIFTTIEAEKTQLFRNGRENFNALLYFWLALYIYIYIFRIILPEFLRLKDQTK